MFVATSQLQIVDELEERAQKRQERQRLLEKMRAGELQELKILEQASADWERAQRIRRFTDCMENKVQQLEDEQKKKILLSWLKWARGKADWLDPLTDFKDDLLGKSQHIFDAIMEVNSSFSKPQA